MAVNVIQLPLDVPLLPVSVLKAGDIVCDYEKGNLRYLRCNDIELLRLIYIAVRNEHWSTAAYNIQEEIIEQYEDSFKVSYTAHYSFEKKVYKADVTIAGKESGEIIFTMQGEAVEDFLSNRIGICVLHPAQGCCGKDVRITNPKGEILEATFPELVSSHQPFMDIASVEWSPSKGIIANLQFHGDIFETEDQRNWTDGSFKTYSTPLSVPFPVNTRIGDSRQQKVIFSVQAHGGPQTDKTIPGSFDEKKIPFPKIGYSRSISNERIDSTSIDYLKQIHFDHYHVALSTNSDDWREQWRLAVSEAKDLSATIVCVVNILEGGDIVSVIDELSADSDVLYSILFVPEKGNVSNEEWIRTYANEIKNKLPGVLLEYGSSSYFAELNRNWLKDDKVDLVSFPVNPQTHAVDYRTMVDNLESHKDLLKTVQTSMTGKMIRVGPVSFAATNKGLRNTQFASWWVLVAIGNFADADAVTIGPAIGDDGLLGGSHYETSPLYKTLKKLKEFEPVWVIQNHRKGFDSEFIVENGKSDRLIIRLKYSF